MKKCKRLAGMLLAVLLVLTMASSVFAATAKPGETVTLWFSHSNVYGIDGEFSFNNPELFTSVSYDTGSSNMSGSAANNKVYLFSPSGEAVSGRIGVRVKVSGSAANGDSCTVTFKYRVVINEQGGMSKWKDSTQTVTVSKTQTPVNPPVKKADTTELEKQIAAAEALNKKEYTAESMKAVTDALSKGRGLLNSSDQSAVDKAAAGLEAAIKGLVKMDYSKLQAAIDAANNLTATEKPADQFAAMFQALLEGNNLLNSTDQAAVDAGAEKLDALVKELKEALDKLNTPTIVEKEVEKEVEPSYPFCNIDIHKVWPVLFFISLDLNIAFIVLIVVYVVRKKRARKDTTPLVDYDINDDEPNNP